MGLWERILRRVAERPEKVPDYTVIARIEQEIDDCKWKEEREEKRRIGEETCFREGCLEPVRDVEKLFVFGSRTPIRILSGCPRCGRPSNQELP